MSGTDAQRIIQLFENELNILHGVSTIDKMKYRRKIMNVLMPLFTVTDMKVEPVIKTVEEKLGDILKMFRDADGFKGKLRRELKEKLK